MTSTSSAAATGLQLGSGAKSKSRLLAYKNEDLLARQVGDGEVEAEEEEDLDLTSVVMRVVLSPLLLPLFLFYAFCFPKRSNYDNEMAKIRQEDRLAEKQRRLAATDGVGEEASNSYQDFSDSSDEDYDDEDEQERTFAESMMAAYGKSVACIVALDARLRNKGQDDKREERRGSAMTLRTKIARDSKYVQAIDVARTDRIVYPYDGVFVKNIFVDIKDSTRLKELIRRLSITDEIKSADGNSASSSLLNGSAEESDEAKATSLIDNLMIQADQIDALLAASKKPSNQRKSSFGNILGGGSSGAKVVPAGEEDGEGEASPETDNPNLAGGGGAPSGSSSSSSSSSSTTTTPAQTTENSSIIKKPKKTPSLEAHGGGIRVNPQVATRLSVEGPSINSLEQALTAEKDPNSPLREKIRQQRRGWSPDSMYDEAFVEAERLSPLSRLPSYLPHGPNDPAGKSVVDYLILQYHQGSPQGTLDSSSHEDR